MSAPAPQPTQEEKPKKILRVTYSNPESVFAIPIGLDLEDKTMVKDWGLKWDTLYIDFVDGTELKIKPTHSAQDTLEFLKYPQDTEILNNDDHLDDDDFETIEALLALAKANEGVHQANALLKAFVRQANAH